MAGSRSSLHIGDIVTVEGIPARGQARQAFAKSVVLAHSGQKVFAPSNKKRALPLQREPAPRWPDGQVRLGPPPGKKGYWGAASASGLVEEHRDRQIAMNDEGLLRDIADADRVAPLQPWAKAVYEYRQRSLLKDDPFSAAFRLAVRGSFKRRMDSSSSSSGNWAAFWCCRRGRPQLAGHIY